MPYTILPVVRPDCLDGQSNGQLHPSILELVPSEREGITNGYQLVKPAARAYRALHTTARSVGLILKPVSASDTYRPYAVQEAIFRQRYTTTYLPGRPYKIWNGVRWYKRPNVATAAVPGTSNHGWGLAIDLGVETDGDIAAESIGNANNPTPELSWLADGNAVRFGFSWETLPEEYWHIRYVRGDSIPQAVLDYEASLNPVPPPPQEDDLILTRFQCLDADAAFFGWANNDGVAQSVEWCDHNADYIYGPHFKRRDNAYVWGLKNLTFVGNLERLNAAETRVEWTAAHFRQYVPAA